MEAYIALVCASCLWVVGERKTGCNANSDALVANPQALWAARRFPACLRGRMHIVWNVGAAGHPISRVIPPPDYLSPRVGTAT